MTIRKTVLTAIHSKKWSINHFAEECEKLGIASRQAIHSWLSGRSNLTDNRASEILNFLELKIVKKPKRKTKDESLIRKTALGESDSQRTETD